MKFTITGRNYQVYPKLEETIKEKYSKFDKYFADDISVKVVISKEKTGEKIETTINVKGGIFRTEITCSDVYEGLDKSVDKIARQMSKFKGRLQKRYKGSRSVRFEDIPTSDETADVGSIVKTKTFELRAMSREEAVLSMEMLDHDFFVYIEPTTDNVNIVYKRKDGNYGVLETTR